MATEEALRLSKSKLQLMDDCSWKFNLRYNYQLKERPTPFSFYGDMGTAFHKDAENYFKGIEMKTGDYEDRFWDNFIKFVENVLKAKAKGDRKYICPVLSEEKIYDKELNFTGIVDAVFVNPDDDEYIIMDWKTGKMKDHDDIREELACYKLVIDRSKKLDKPIKYWAMFFVKTGDLFFEEARPELCVKMEEKIHATRDRITKEDFMRNTKNCHFCGYHMRFGGVCGGEHDADMTDEDKNV